MFGLGAGELILIAVVALLFVGPDKLPAAAKAIGKGIRDLRRQTSDLTRTIEEDTQIGDAVRDLRSALRGEEPPPPRPQAPRPPPADAAATAGAPATPLASAAGAARVPPVPASAVPALDDASAGAPTTASESEDDDGPVARGPATRPADVRSLAGLTTGTLRDRATAGAPAAAADASAPSGSDDPDAGNGSAHG